MSIKRPAQNHGQAIRLQSIITAQILWLWHRSCDRPQPESEAGKSSIPVMPAWRLVATFFPTATRCALHREAAATFSLAGPRMVTARENESHSTAHQAVHLAPTHWAFRQQGITDGLALLERAPAGLALVFVRQHEILRSQIGWRGRRYADACRKYRVLGHGTEHCMCIRHTKDGSIKDGKRPHRHEVFAVSADDKERGNHKATLWWKMRQWDGSHRPTDSPSADVQPQRLYEVAVMHYSVSVQSPLRFLRTVFFTTCREPDRCRSWHNICPAIALGKAMSVEFQGNSGVRLDGRPKEVRMWCSP